MSSLCFGWPRGFFSGNYFHPLVTKAKPLLQTYQKLNHRLTEERFEMPKKAILPQYQQKDELGRFKIAALHRVKDLGLAAWICHFLKRIIGN